MKMHTISGAAIAAAAAGMLISGVGMTTQASAKAALGHCMGANACKGQSACKSGDHACKGQNACKGQGFAELSKGKCSKAGGSFEKA